MPAAIMLVYTNAPADRVEEFKQWYGEIHIPDICSIPGIASGQLHELEGQGTEQIARDGQPTVARFLAIYQLEHDDVDAINSAIAEHAPAFKAAGRMFDGMQAVSRSIYRAA